MRVYSGVDLGSTTTKAVLLDGDGALLGRGITNSRSNYRLAADIAEDEALIDARFTLLDRALADGELKKRLRYQLRKVQRLAQLDSLRAHALAEAEAPRLGARRDELRRRLVEIFAAIAADWGKPRLGAVRSDFFRDQAASDFARLAEAHADPALPFELLMSVFDKTILLVENERLDLGFEGNIRQALAGAVPRPDDRAALEPAVLAAARAPFEVERAIGTGYGRQTLPFAKENIRSEILCHGLGAHAMFPRTRTVLDIGGQDTKAIQVDADGIVTSFQMNDRCAAGCGRYLGYIADEMNMGVHDLGPLALQSTRHVKISSTCTVFAGAELRDRLTMGQKREDILAGLHRAIILRAMALLARSGGVAEEMTFTGGVASNPAAVAALRQLLDENYGARTLNISPSSIYTGALGAALFAVRA